MLGDYQRALESSGSDFGYCLGLTLAFLGRTDEAISTLREREQINPPRLGRLYLTSLRALLEAKREESLEASEELRKATFRDPEGMYYLARQISYLGQIPEALEMLSRAIDNGFFCYPAMVRDPWFETLRTRTEFTGLLHKSQQLCREASASFLAAGGGSLLRIHAEVY
jgi:tetratricopeptide (TPR) repeat protein